MISFKEFDLQFDELVNKFSILNTLKNVQQNPQYHWEGDVFKHTKCVCLQLEWFKEFQNLSPDEKSILYMAAAFHDIGKPKTTKLEDGRLTSPNHGVIGTKVFREYFYKECPMDFYEREKVASLIRYHGVPLFFLEKENVEKAVIRTSLNTNLKLLYLLAKSDLYGRICTDDSKLGENLELFKETAIELGCYGQPFKFKNELTKQAYFNGSSVWHSDELYDKNCFKVIMLCGIPYAGKDEYIKKNFSGYNVICLDDIRREFKISPKDGSKEAITIGKERAREFLRKKECFIWNATNTKKEIRRSLVNLFFEYGGITEIHYVESPYKEILKRMETRDRVVPKEVVDKMITNMDMAENSEGKIIRNIFK